MRTTSMARTTPAQKPRGLSKSKVLPLVFPRIAATIEVRSSSPRARSIAKKSHFVARIASCYFVSLVVHGLLSYSSIDSQNLMPPDAPEIQAIDEQICPIPFRIFRVHSSH